jgi:hypothetical protein
LNLTWHDLEIQLMNSPLVRWMNSPHADGVIGDAAMLLTESHHVFVHVRDKSGPPQCPLVLLASRHAREEPPGARRPRIPHGAPKRRVDRAVIRLVANRHKFELPSLVHVGNPEQRRGFEDTSRSRYPDPNRARQKPSAMPEGALDDPNAAALRGGKVVPVTGQSAHGEDVAERRRSCVVLARKWSARRRIADTFFTLLLSLAPGQEMKMCPQW